MHQTMVTKEGKHESLIGWSSRYCPATIETYTRHRLLVAGHFDLVSNAACGNLVDVLEATDKAYWLLALLI